MTVVLPRLARPIALEMIERLRLMPLDGLERELPLLSVEVTYSPVGGARIEDEDLRSLRAAIRSLAAEHGFPGPIQRQQEFEGQGARLLRDRLQLTPYEAAQEEAWSYLTVCWLMDIAVWRFPNAAAAAADRFIGNLNRNTFRRMWWRAEVFGSDIDLTRLGEDEMGQIMERRTLFTDVRLGRSIAREFLQRVDEGEGRRMLLMREATKRILRLTPFVDFGAIDEATIRSVVADAFDVTTAGLQGSSLPMRPRVRDEAPPPTEGVTEVMTVSVAAPAPHSADIDDGVIELDEVGNAALDIARRTGRVTNVQLREVVPIDAEQARQVLQHLVTQGRLNRFGVAKGTYYMLPTPPATEPPAATVSPRAPVPTQGRSQRPSDTALRRLLRRSRQR